MTLHTLRRGDTGPVLLFLHYFGGSGRTWTPVMDALRDSFRCVAPDLRGWGESKAAPPTPQVWGEDGLQSGARSTRPKGADAKQGTVDIVSSPQTWGAGGGFPFSVDSMARDVRELVDTLNGAPFALVGHSMGGKVAQAVAAQGPTGLKALLLVAPSPASPEPMTDSGRAQLRAAWGSKSEARRIVDSITLRPLPPEWDTLAVEDTLRGSREAWQAWTDSGSREDISGRMADIHVPTRIFAGEHDHPLTPQFLQNSVAKRIAGVAVVTIPGTCHLVPLEKPAELAQGIRAFVAPLLL